MNNITAYLLGVLVTGCGTGVSSDPMGSNPKPLEAEPTSLLANVRTTQAITSDAQNDATYVAIVEDAETHSARLVRQDIRYAEITELDRMPSGKGTAQLVLGTGATLGEPTMLFHLTNDGVTRYTVDYQPRAIFPLHNRLVILTEEGTLLEQPIGADN